MKKETKTLHVALQNSDRKQAEIFYKKILNLQFNKTFSLSKELSNQIFKIYEEVTVDVYCNEESYFEIFITKTKNQIGFNHICIKIEDKKDLIKRCKKYNIDPLFVKKGEKTLLFIRDFSDNLFEIKEKQKK